MTIPIDARFRSLNLAQAVAINAYEWRVGVSAAPPPAFADDAAPATQAELAGLYEHLEGELEAAGFFFPPEKTPSMVRNLRAVFARAKLSAQEAATLRGVVTALIKGRGRVLARLAKERAARGDGAMSLLRAAARSRSSRRRCGAPRRKPWRWRFSRAGGMGQLAAAGLRPEQIGTAVAELKRDTDAPFAVNFLMTEPGAARRRRGRGGADAAQALVRGARHSAAARAQRLRPGLRRPTPRGHRGRAAGRELRLLHPDRGAGRGAARAGRLS